MTKLGIVPDFQTSEIEIDHISLSMRDINKLQQKSKIDRAWVVNNSVRMINDPKVQKSSHIEPSKF